jgi:hypothetical protein
LALVASALAVVGYALAFTYPRPSASTSPSHVAEPARSSGGSPVGTGRAELRYQPGPGRRVDLRFDHLERAGDVQSSTRVDVDIREARRPRSGRASGVRFVRNYERAGVSIEEGDEVVGARISRQIESFLVGVKSVVEVDAIGKPVDREWKSVTNPQVRQTLRMLRHAHSLLTPRPHRGPVNIGEEWDYRMPVDHLETEQVESIEGDVHIRESLEEIVERDGRRIAVLGRVLEAEAAGTVRAGADGEPRAFEMTASGSGRARFAVDEGALVESELEVERSLVIGEEGGTRRERTGELEWRLAESSASGE